MIAALALAAALHRPAPRPMERILVRLTRRLAAAGGVGLLGQMAERLSAQGCRVKAGAVELTAACPVAPAGAWLGGSLPVLVSPVPGGTVRRLWPAPVGPLGWDPLLDAWRLDAVVGPVAPGRGRGRWRLVLALPEPALRPGVPFARRRTVWWLPPQGGRLRLTVLAPDRRVLAGVGLVALVGVTMIPGWRHGAAARSAAGRGRGNGRRRR